MISFNWTIRNLERYIDDGGVIFAHWGCNASDGEQSESAYGVRGFSYDASAPDFVAYKDLTEAIVLNWILDGRDDWKAEIEASLKDKIEKNTHPATAVGVPW